VAKANLERAEALNPHYPLLEVSLGILAGQLHDRAGAELHFHRAAALSPSDVDTHFYYADWLVRDGRATAALPELHLAIRLGPARPEARELLMKLAAASGDTASLRTLAAEAQSYDAADPDAAAVFAGGVPGTDPGTTYDACFNTGLDAIGSDRFLDAALANRKALRFNPNSADAWINLGWSLAQLGLDAQSAHAFERALQLRPGDEHAKSNLEWVRRGKK
jgi:Flp pilus assembly protein TadD